MLELEYLSTIKGRQPGTGWMLPLSWGWDFQFPGLSRVVAADEGPWKVLLFLNPLFGVLSKSGSVSAESLSLTAGLGELLLISQGLLLWASMIFMGSLVA